MLIFPEGVELQLTLLGRGKKGVFVATLDQVNHADIVILVHSYWPDARSPQTADEKRKAEEAMNTLSEIREANVYDTGTRKWQSSITFLSYLSGYHHWAKRSIKLERNLIVGQNYGNLRRYLREAKLLWAFVPIAAWLDALAHKGILIRIRGEEDCRC